MKIAFLGLGIMGRRMAARLLAQGHDLTVYNRTPEAASALREQGAAVAGHPADAVREAEVVFTMLADPEAVAALAFGEHGFLGALPAGALWIDCSTVNPAFSRQEAAQAQSCGVRFLDAPVAGSAPQAEQGALTFFVGGDAADLETVRPLLEILGRKIIHAGPNGQGTGLKMLVNMLLGQAMLAFAEALALGRGLGFDAEFLLQLLPQLPVAAPFIQAKAERIGRQDFSAQFPLEHMHKDLHLAGLTAYETKQPLPLTQLAKELYAQARAAGYGRQDFSAISEFLQRFSKDGSDG